MARIRLKRLDLPQVCFAVSPPTQSFLAGRSGRVIGLSAAFAIQTLLRSDVEKRDRQLRTLGVDHALRTLHPTASWNDLKLIFAAPGSQSDVVSDGRGIVLIPTTFVDEVRVSPPTPQRPPCVIYPIPDKSLTPPPEAGGISGAKRRDLVALLGRTRARILLCVQANPGISTSLIADQCAVSIASASEHATVLRNGGLVDSERRGRNVVHYPTYVGASLLA